MLSSIPSPPGDGLHLGGFRLRAYGLMIALGVVAAVQMAQHRWRARGGDPADISRISLWAVPAGVIGARAYHVVTDNQIYRDHPFDAFKIWQGGLGIWGGVAGGVVVGLWVARRLRLDAGALLDVVAPALPLAQAIGRWGNYFNQELFGRPSSLPWAVRIDLAHRPLGYERFATFHPTFLYESLWDLAVVGLVLYVERRVRLAKGWLFAVYVSLYTFGRFWTEWLRIDPAHRYFGLRLNDWTSLVGFVVSTGLLLAFGRRRPAAAAPAEERPVEEEAVVPAALGGPAGVGGDERAEPASAAEAATEPSPEPQAGQDSGERPAG